MLKKLQAAGGTPDRPDSIGQRMREARRRCKATQAELADELEVSRQTIWDWENDKRAPSKIAVVAVAQVTGTDSDWILTGETTVAPKGVLGRYNRRATDPHYIAPLSSKSPVFVQCKVA